MLRLMSNGGRGHLLLQTDTNLPREIGQEYRPHLDIS